MCKSILDEETWSNIILNHDFLIFKEINNATKFDDFQNAAFFRPIFCLDRPCRFQSNKFILSFFFIFISSAPEYKNWKLIIWPTNRKMMFLPQC